jgi:hypothetical protein
MAGQHRQVLHDDLALAAGRQLVVTALVADDVLALVDVEVAVRERDTGVADGPDAGDHVGAAVARAVAKRDERRFRFRCRRRGRGGLILRRRLRPLERHVDVAVRCHDDVPSLANAVGEHRCADPGRQREAAIVAGALRRERSVRGRRGGRAVARSAFAGAAADDCCGQENAGDGEPATDDGVDRKTHTCLVRAVELKRWMEFNRAISRPEWNSQVRVPSGS